MNEYFIDGDIIKIKIVRKNGDIYYCIIDKDDLNKIIEVDRKWFIGFRNNGDIAHVKCRKNKEILIHRLIMDCEENQYVDHIDRNPLNNRKENLRIVTYAENNQNIGTRKDNTSGVRGVDYRKKNNTWRGRVNIDGKSYHVLQDKDKKKVEQAVIEFRRKHMTHSEMDKTP